MNDVRPGRPAAHALSAFGPHVGASLGGKFQCGIVGQGPAPFRSSPGCVPCVLPRKPHIPTPTASVPAANCDDVFRHCWPPYRQQCRNDANVAVATTLKCRWQGRLLGACAPAHCLSRDGNTFPCSLGGTGLTGPHATPRSRCPFVSIYRHIPRMRAPISSFGPWPAVRAAVPAGTTGQAVRSNRPSSFSGMKRVLEA